MVEFIKNIIRLSAMKAGIPEENIIDYAPDSITLPKPRLDIQVLPETFTKTGRKLALNRSSDGFKEVLSIFEARLSVVCNIYTKDITELEKLSDAFIKALPRKFADEKNNVVKSWVASGEWKVSGGAQIGLKKVEPIKTRARLIRIDFIYHVTEDKLTPYMQEFTLNHGVKNG